jgi:hypothetical protein
MVPTWHAFTRSPAPALPAPDAGKDVQRQGIDGNPVYNLYVYYQDTPC